ncbi:AAA family ATPase [Streptomyces goshikiensis]|uniref:AAA family ATPase n=1 Tax=Streptomyces goshikiensis TaxID=1942 RepID=UPI0036B436C4
MSQEIGKGHPAQEDPVATADGLLPTGRTRVDEARRTQVIPAVATEAFEQAEARFIARDPGRHLDQGQRTLARVLALSDRLAETGYRAPGTGVQSVLGLLADAVGEAGGRAIGISPTATTVPWLSAALGGAPAHVLSEWCESRTGTARLRPGDMLIVTDAHMVLSVWPDHVRDVIDEVEAAGAVIRLIGVPA